MSTKNTKKNETKIAAASSSLDEIAIGSERKPKDLVSMKCVLCQGSIYICSYEIEIKNVIIVIGFQKLIDPTKLSARYQKTGVEAPSDIKPQSITTRSQHDNQMEIPRLGRGMESEKGKF